MKLFKYNRLLKASLLVSAFLIVPRILNAQINTLIDGNDDDNDGVMLTPPGLYVTPTAPLTGARQQLLNPGHTPGFLFEAGAIQTPSAPDQTR